MWSVLLCLLCVSVAAADWGRIHIRNDTRNQLRVSIENSRMYVDYRPSYRGLDGGGYGERSYITEFLNKTVPAFGGAVQETQGSWLDFAEGKGIVNRANIVEETDEFKTVEMEWNCALQRIPIYKESRVLKIEYVRDCGQALDRGSPGARLQGAFITGGLANPLVYKEHTVLGVYNESNGRGFGREYPSKNISVITSVDRGAGFDVATRDAPFTSYLFMVNGGGEEELIEIGKSLIDGNIPVSPAVVNVSDKKKVSFFPVPSMPDVRSPLIIPLTAKGEIRADITGINGKVMTSVISKGAEEIRFPPLLLKSGVYVLTVTTSRSAWSGKFFISN
jgi:hypothetical protein